MKAAPIAYSYLRFSNPEQAEGDSIRRQTAMRDAWLEKNGATLDKTLAMQDSGVSAFKGQHRKDADRHCLAGFLQCCEEGRVRPGSYLLVENLDRLSRESIRPALSLFLQILDHKVNVVQLQPEKTFHHDKTDPFDLMGAIMELSRAHSESARKSERVGATWGEKRKDAATGMPLTPRCPAWLRLVGNCSIKEEGKGRFEVIEPKAATVRKIYKWAVEGHGLTAILNRLNAEQIQPLAGDHWARSYIALILKDRRVLGEIQFYTGRRKERKPDGKPVAGYYPAIVDESTWFAARAALTGRKLARGREATDTINIFKGLLRDARNGVSIHVAAGDGVRKFVPYVMGNGTKGGKYVSFPEAAFEQAILAKLKELDPADVLPRHDKAAKNLLTLSGKLADLDGKIEKWKAKVMESPDVDELADVLGRLSKERKAVAEELATAQQAAASPLTSAWADGRKLLSSALKTPELRLRLRAALRRLITKGLCLFVGVKRIRLAAVQLFFQGGAQRTYIIAHKPDYANAKGRTKGWTHSVSTDAMDNLDLRKSTDAKRAEQFLTSLEFPVS